MRLDGLGPGVDDAAVMQQLDVQAKYDGYLSRQRAEIVRQQQHESARIPEAIDYDQVTGLSNEARHKLMDTRPYTIGQATRIPGVTPAAISLLLIHLKKRA